jgi:hypothetical protein
MYFPTTSARQLETNPILPDIPPESVVALAPSPRKVLFCTLSRTGLAVWSVRVRLVPGEKAVVVKSYLS